MTDPDTPLTGLPFTPRDNPARYLNTHTSSFNFQAREKKKKKLQKIVHLLIQPSPHFLEVSKACKFLQEPIPIFNFPGVFLAVPQADKVGDKGQGWTEPPVIIPHHSTQLGHRL